MQENGKKIKNESIPLERHLTKHISWYIDEHEIYYPTYSWKVMHYSNRDSSDPKRNHCPKSQPFMSSHSEATWEVFEAVGFFFSHRKSTQLYIHNQFTRFPSSWPRESLPSSSAAISDLKDLVPRMA
jgi:hypothetical protein